jgi:hypothetical protein
LIDAGSQLFLIELDGLRGGHGYEKEHHSN